MAVKLPPLCPSRQGSGARGCELTAPSLATIHLPLLKKTISMAHSSEYFWSVFIDLELQVQLNWFSPSQPSRAWLHLLSDLKATGRLLLLSWLNQACSSSLSSQGSPVPQPQTPPLDSLCALQAPAGLRSSPVKDAHTPMVLLFLLSFYRNSRLGTHHPA